MKRTIAILLLAMLLIAAVPATSLAATPNYTYKTLYRVTTRSGNLNVHTGAGTSYRVIMSIPKGTAVMKLKEKKVGNATWYQIKTTANVTGWVEAKGRTHQDYIGKGAYAKVNTKNSGLNVRKGPGTNYGLVKKGSIPKGTVIKVDAISGSWVRVPSYNDGWAFLSYLKWVKK